ncbi:MAG: NAD(P)-dependent oxidoreductase [Betaproteobacteria bacterium]|nr:NAD(P)-dependent oxidoreductase [Betaproteobacteria bacterium]
MTHTSSSLTPVSPERTRVGFVGIGNMGTPMAGHLIKAGWRVSVYDIDPAKVRAVVQAHGGTAAASLAELGKISDVVITMLPDGRIVRAVALGNGPSDDCLPKGLARGAVIIDMSSSSPVGTRELGAELDRIGIALLDAPVSGGVRGAVAGTLAIMVGGDRELAERHAPLLNPMGRRFYAGSLGSGHAVKVLNNFVSAAGLVAAGEALIIGERFGIDPKVMLDIVNASSGRNNSTENKFVQFILNRKFNSGFALGLMAKDLALAMEVAKAVEVPAEMGRACLELWQDAEKALGGGADHTEIVRHLGEL